MLVSCGGDVGSSAPAYKTLAAIKVKATQEFSGVGLTLQLKATGTYADASTSSITALLATWTSATPLWRPSMPRRPGSRHRARLHDDVRNHWVDQCDDAAVDLQGGLVADRQPFNGARLLHRNLMPNGKVLVTGGEGKTRPR